MSSEEIEYFRHRARQERESAEHSKNAQAAKAHEELALLYEGLADRSVIVPGSSPGTARKRAGA